MEWDEQHFVVGVAASEVSDLEFLRLLFKRNGKDFGHEMFGAPPHEIVTSLQDEPELPNLFLQCLQSLTDCVGLFAGQPTRLRRRRGTGSSRSRSGEGAGSEASTRGDPVSAIRGGWQKWHRSQNGLIRGAFTAGLR